MRNYLLLFLLSGLVILPMTTANPYTVPIRGKTNATSVSATLVANTTHLEVSEAFTVSLSIHNGYFWNLSEVSYNLTFDINPADFHILRAKNTTNISYNTTDKITEQIVGVSISKIPHNSTASFHLVGKIENEGSCPIQVSRISFQKTRGPLHEFDRVSCVGLTLTVEERKVQQPLPPEGDIDLEPFIFLILIVLPPLLLSTLAYVGRKKFP